MTRPIAPSLDSVSLYTNYLFSNIRDMVSDGREYGHDEIPHVVALLMV